MIQKVETYICEHKLLQPNDKVLTALSGGADSVALLLVLQELGYEVEAAHCNFHLRGDESDRDEAFVRRLCTERGVKLHVIHFDTAEYAQQHHLSIEMAARELRYDWFETLRKDRGAAAIAVAHHADDSIETLLLNLLRGTGIRGLQGIRPKNGHIVRPLLCVSRTDIEAFLGSLGQGYVTDSTNLHDDYLRNKIRLNLLPLLEEINPAARENLLKTTRHLSEAYTLYDKAIDEASARVSRPGGLHIPTLLNEAEPQTVLFELLHPKGFNSAQVDDIFRSLTGQAGKAFASATHQVVKDRDLLLIAPLEQPLQPPTLRTSVVPCDEHFHLCRERHTASFDADKLTAPLTVRRWQHGDTFVPFGMTGRKLVSDYLTDRKFSLLAKERLWVLCCGEDIVWLIGERTDNRYRITPHTRRVMVVEVVQ